MNQHFLFYMGERKRRTRPGSMISIDDFISYLIQLPKDRTPALVDFENNFLEFLRHTPQTFWKWTFRLTCSHLDSRGGSLLHFAVDFNLLKLAKWLLKEGLRPDQTDNDFRSPFIKACFLNHLEMVKLILVYNPNIHAVDFNLKSAIHYAINPEIIKILIEKGALFADMGNSNITPLKWACQKMQWPKVTILLHYGAQMTYCNEGLEEVHTLAQIGNSFMVVQFLQAKFGAFIAREQQEKLF